MDLVGIIDTKKIATHAECVCVFVCLRFCFVLVIYDF